MRDTYEVGVSLGLMPSDLERLPPQERWNVLTYCRENGTPLQRIEFYLEYLLFYFVNSHAKVDKSKLTFPKRGQRQQVEEAIEKAVSGGKYQQNRRQGRRGHGVFHPSYLDGVETGRIALNTLVEISVRAFGPTSGEDVGHGG